MDYSFDDVMMETAGIVRADRPRKMFPNLDEPRVGVKPRLPGRRCGGKWFRRSSRPGSLLSGEGGRFEGRGRMGRRSGSS